MPDEHEERLDRQAVRYEMNDFYQSKEYLAGCRRDGKKRPVVAVIPEMYFESPAPCTYIRMFTPLMSASFCSAFEVRIATLQSALRLKPDVAIINRVPCGNVSGLTEFFAHLRRSGTRLIYDIDDQLLDLADSHPEATVYSDRQAVVRELLDRADIVWVSTPALAEALRPYCRSIVVMENYLDIELWPLISTPTGVSPRRDSPFNILYMGTTTHAADLRLVLDALLKLGADGEKFRLNLIGVSADPPRHDWVSIINPPEDAGNNNYPEFMRWLRSLTMFDLGIAPLEKTRFNRCKSAIKFWDYTSMGIPTLASRTEAYSGIIVDGENGLLAENNVESWYIQLRNAMKGNIHLANVATKARASLEKLYARIDGSVARRNSVRQLLDGAPPYSAGTVVAGTGSGPVSRESIAATYLAGEGIEVGALHNPLALPQGARARYVDRMPKQELYAHYPELRELPLVDVDIIDDGESLSTIEDGSQDFVIANHFLEHSEDPIATLTNLLRVLKEGGVVYLAVPNMAETFDRNRGETSLVHLIADHEQGVETSRKTHYEEWVSLVEPHFARSYEGAAFAARVDELMLQKYSIHFHCWSVRGFREFLDYLKNDRRLPLDVALFADRGDEYIAILIKRQAN